MSLAARISTEEEAELVLMQSYQMMAPLGMPTLIIDPADYDPRLSIWCKQQDDTIENHLKARLGNVLYGFYGENSSRVQNFIDGSGRFWMALVSQLEYCIRTSQMVAHARTEKDFFNVVICPRTNDTGSLLIKYGLHIPEERIPDIPGLDHQWNFIKLWHEFGHGLRGPSEADADWVSAIVHQYAFADSTPLMVLSDFRAAQAILHYDREKPLSQRGWSLVDTLDHALSSPVPQTWDDVLLRVPQAPDVCTHARDIRHIGESFKRVSRLAFSEPDLLMLGMMADHMAYRGNVDNENQLRIARRFSIAAQRLSIGVPAYAATAPKLSL